MADLYGIETQVLKSIAETPVTLGTEIVFIGVASGSGNQPNLPVKINSWAEYLDVYESEAESGSTWTSSLDVSADYAFNTAGIDHAWFINMNTASDIGDEDVTPTMVTHAADALDDIHRIYGIIPSVVVLPHNNYRPTLAPSCVSALVAKCKKIDDVYKAQVIFDNCVKAKDIQTGSRGEAKLKPDIDKDCVDGNAIACVGFMSKSASDHAPLSVIVACSRAVQDAANIGGLPYRTVGNIRVAGTKYGAVVGTALTKLNMSKSDCNAVAAAGFVCAINKGSNKFYTWGDHTAAVSGDGDVDDELYRFDSNVAMTYHIANRFIAKWENVIDDPMTLALRNDIINEEQNYLNYLVSIGALVGSPKCEFRSLDNTKDTVGKGQFIFTDTYTHTIPAKYIKLNVQYTDDGLSAYIAD